MAALALSLPAAAAAAPAAPTALHVDVVGPKQVALSWKASTSSNISGYHVYRNGRLVGTSDADSPNYFDQGAPLINGVRQRYTVDAFDPSGSSAVTGFQTATPALDNALVTCGGTALLNASRHYVLSNDVTALTNKPCFTFDTGSNLSLDCQGHSITVNSGSKDAIDITNVNGFMVSNCVINQNTNGKLIKATNSSYGRIVDNTFQVLQSLNSMGVSVDIENTPNTVVGEAGHINTFAHSYIEFVDSPYAYSGYDTFQESGPGTSAATWFTHSSNSTAVHNTIDGGYGGEVPATTGEDDDYMLEGPNDNLNISWNKLSNTYDAGVEVWRQLTNSKINNNTISNVAISGIGAYWDTDMTGNTISGNKIDHTSHAIYVGTDWDSDMTSTSFRASNNTFDSNTFTSPTSASATEVEWAMNGDPAHPSIPVVSTGNVFTNNQFGQSALTPVFSPAGAVSLSTSTGNHCPANTLIGCAATPVVTAGDSPEHQTDGKYILHGLVDPQGLSTVTKIEYGTSTSYGTIVSSSIFSGTTPQQATIFTSVLPTGTTYHYRVDASNSAGSTVGPDQVFGPGVVTAGDPPEYSAGKWILRGLVDPRGLLTYGKIEYGTTTSYGTVVSSSGVAPGDPQQVPGLTTTLAVGTTIHYRIDASNALGMTNGPDQTFVVTGPPLVTAGVAPLRLGVGNYYLTGTVDPQGLSTATAIEYGTTTSYGTSVQASDVAPGSAHQVNISVTGLTPGVTYHYRTLGTNGDDTTFGPDNTFVAH